MTTPMIPNLKLHGDFDSNLVDPLVYRQLIGSLMYLVNRLELTTLVVLSSEQTNAPQLTQLTFNI